MITCSLTIKPWLGIVGSEVVQFWQLWVSALDQRHPPGDNWSALLIDCDGSYPTSARLLSRMPCVRKGGILKDYLNSMYCEQVDCCLCIGQHTSLSMYDGLIWGLYQQTKCVCINTFKFRLQIWVWLCPACSTLPEFVPCTLLLPLRWLAYTNNAYTILRLYCVQGENTAITIVTHVLFKYISSFSFCSWMRL